MSAGGSDFSGVAQGGIGQGFANGVESGLNQYNKGLDRKQQQAHTMLNNFVAPNLARLGKPIPMPDTDDPELLRQWKAAEDARQTGLSAATKQAEGLLKQLGSPMDINQFTALYYDPATAVDTEAQVTARGNIGRFAELEERRKALYNKLVSMPENTEGYQEMFKQYNQFITDEYNPVYKGIRGRDYQNDVNDPTVWAGIRNREALKTNNRTYLTNAATVTGDPQIERLLSDPDVNLNETIPGTNMTWRQYIDAKVDSVGLDNLLKQGDTASVTALIGRLQVMPDDKRMELSADLKMFWSNVLKEQQTPGSSGNLAIQSAVGSFVKQAAEVQQAVNTVKIQGLDMTYREESITQIRGAIKLQDFQIDNNQREAVYRFGALALEGNRAVLSGRADFDALLGDMPKEEKDRLWTESVVNPLREYDKKQAQSFEAVRVQIDGMKLNQASQYQELAQKGMLQFVIPRDENNKIIRSGMFWQNALQAYGGDADLAERELNRQISVSISNFDNFNAKTQQDLTLGAAQVRVTEANATQAEARAEYAKDFAALEYETAVTTEARNKVGLTNDQITTQRQNVGLEADKVGLEQAKVNLDISKVDQRLAALRGTAQAGEYLSVMVEKLGVNSLNNPEVQKLLVREFGEAGAANVKKYLTDQAAWDESVKKSQALGQKVATFNAMFDSPATIRAFSQNPGQVAEIAKAVGADPRQTQMILGKLATENSVLTSQQIKNLAFQLQEGKSRLNLAWEQFAYGKEHDSAVMAQDANQFEKSFGLDLSKFSFTKEQQRLDNIFRERQFTTQNYQWQTEYRRGVYQSNRAFQFQEATDRRDFNFQKFVTNRSYQFQVDTDARDFKFASESDKRDFEYQKGRDQVADHWTAAGYWQGVSRAAQEQSNWLADFYLRSANSAADRDTANSQIRVQLLQPLQQQATLMQGQIDDSTKALGELQAQAGVDGPALSSNTIQLTKKFDENGNWVGYTASAKVSSGNAKAAYDRLGTKVDDYAYLMYLRDKAQAAVTNINGTLETVINNYTSKTGQDDPYQISGDSNPFGGRNTGPTGDPKSAVVNFKSYVSDTPIGADLAGRIRDLTSGKLPGQGFYQFNQENFCLTAVQAIFDGKVTYPGFGSGIKGGKGGARSWISQAVGAGMIKVNQGKPLTAADVRAMPDGTILFQESGVPEGHIAVVMGGKVVETSKYAQNKIYGQFGTSTAEAYVGRVKGATTAYQIPTSWWNAGSGTNYAFQPSKGQGTTTTTNGGSKTAAPVKPAAATTPKAFTGGDGGFAPVPSRFQALAALAMKNGRGRLVSDKVDTGPLTVPYGDKNMLINDKGSTMNIVGAFGMQLSQHMSAQGANLAQAAKKDPQGFAKVVGNMMKEAGFGGNASDFVLDWFKTRGWAK